MATVYQLAAPAAHPIRLPWIEAVPGVPYFREETGAAWTPIGQNDAITWPELKGLYQRRDLPGAERYLAMLAGHGVTCLRLMLEYCQVEGRYFEGPAGHFRPEMVQLWDDLFHLCAKHGLRILLTPVDTFFMWIRWSRHPYNRKNGGPCASIQTMLLCPETRVLIRRRLEFCAERWGGSGALFGWDLWNEIHPSYAQDSAACFDEFIADLSDTVRSTELRCHGKAHPQTVSVFGPHLAKHAEMPDAIYRHRDLDFASTHLYEEGSIDHPRNTVDAAVSFGRLVRLAIAETSEGRPYFDSEHGPIHSFKDHHHTLPAAFDDEYFRHMQWAHLASGGAGGGMRWPNRHPHSLTPGMRLAQRGMARFLPLIQWATFRRRNLNEELRVDHKSLATFGCADERQAVVYLLRKDTVGRRGRLRRNVGPLRVTLRVPGLQAGRYKVTAWDTLQGEPVGDLIAMSDGKWLEFQTPDFVADVALAIRP